MFIDPEANDNRRGKRRSVLYTSDPYGVNKRFSGRVRLE